MTVEFTNLETLAEKNRDLMLSDDLATQKSGYENATPEEILHRLTEVAETYAVLAPTLPANLQYSAKKEIEFFLSIYQDKLKKSSQIHKLPQIQESVHSLSNCAGAILDELLNSKKHHHLQTFEIARAM